MLSSPPALTYLGSAFIADPAIETDEAMVDEALRVLHRYSLLDHDRHSCYREVRVHQLVQRATRENLLRGLANRTPPRSLPSPPLRPTH